MFFIRAQETKTTQHVSLEKDSSGFVNRKHKILVTASELRGQRNIPFVVFAVIWSNPSVQITVAVIRYLNEFILSLTLLTIPVAGMYY